MQDNNKYIPKYRPIERGSNEWYLYHARENENMIVPLLTISPFMLFLKGGIIALIIAWCLYFLAAQINNDKLNRNPLVLKKRKEYKEMRKISDPRDPKYQTEYYKQHPAEVPGTPEFQAVVDRLQNMIDEDRYKNM